MASHSAAQGQTRYVYDASGQRTIKINPDGSSHLFSYNQQGQLLFEGRYNAAKQLHSQRHYIWLNDTPVGFVVKNNNSEDWNIYAIHTDRLQNEIGNGFDIRGNQTSVTDQRGLITQYTYNAHQQVTQTNSPDTGITNYLYDQAGNRQQQQDARGVLSRYQYDALNRLTGLTYPSAAQENIRFVYDNKPTGQADQNSAAVGRLSEAHSEMGHQSYRYDDAGRMIASTQHLSHSQAPQTTLTCELGYNPAGRLNKLRYPSGLVVNYDFDDAGRINTISLDTGGVLDTTLVSDVSYQPFGPISSIAFGNDTLQSKSYDQDYRTIANSVISDGLLSDTPLYSASYSYDANNNVSGWSEQYGDDANDANNTRARSFSYNANDWLTQETLAGANTDYAYDAVGNRISRAGSAAQRLRYAANANRLSALNGTSISYDAAGNQLSNDKGSFTYNAANRMASHSAAQGQTRYVYDASGQRTIKTNADGSSHLFSYNQQGQLLFEGRYNASKQLHSELHYIWLNDTPVGFVVKNNNSEDWNIYAIHTDHLNTPRLVTNQNGREIWRWASDVFGEGDAVGSIEFNLRFPGQYYDGESGLHYNYFRDYNAQTGRYVQSDPIGLAGGLNTYLYANGNAVNYIDPYGLWAWGDPLPKNVNDFATGVADAASLGLGPLARSAMGINGGVDQCSDAYAAGQWASLAFGFGRLTYAGIAKIGSRYAANGASAVAFRNGLKRTMRGPLAFSRYRVKSYSNMIDEYGTDAAVQAAAGRTSRGWNAVGSNMAAGGSIGSASNCGCEK